MEVMNGVTRKKKAGSDTLDVLPPDRQSEFVLRESKSTYDRLVKDLVVVPNLWFDYADNFTDVNKIMRNALSILRQTKGTVRPHGNSRFKAVGPADVIHALLAKGAGCDELVTFDTGFEEMNGFDVFEGLEFRVLK